MRFPDSPNAYPGTPSVFPASLTAYPASPLVYPAEAGGGYSPISEPSPVVWFDMLDPTSYTVVGGTAISDITNKVSSVVWTTPATDTPYSATGLNGKPALLPTTAAHRITSIEAAVIAAMTNAPALTVYYQLAFNNADQAAVVFAVSANATTIRYFGQSAAGNGRYLATFTNDAGTTDNEVSAGDATTNMETTCWFTAGATMSGSRNNGAADPNGGAHNPGTLTPTTAALFSVPLGTPSGVGACKFGELWLFAALHDAATRTRVIDYIAARWA